jgi:hypothetical protein
VNNSFGVIKRNGKGKIKERKRKKEEEIADMRI